MFQVDFKDYGREDQVLWHFTKKWLLDNHLFPTICQLNKAVNAMSLTPNPCRWFMANMGNDNMVKDIKAAKKSNTMFNYIRTSFSPT